MEAKRVNIQNPSVYSIVDNIYRIKEDQWAISNDFKVGAVAGTNHVGMGVIDTLRGNVILRIDIFGFDKESPTVIKEVFGVEGEAEKGLVGGRDW